MPSFEKKSTAATGILHHNKRTPFFQLNRYFPDPLLADFIEHFWVVEWSLQEGYTHIQEVLPSLSVLLTFEGEEARVYGVRKQRFIQHISGTGSVVGVRFKPGGFYPFLLQPLQTMAGEEREAYSLLGIPTPQITIVPFSDHGPALEAITTLLHQLLPKTTSQMQLVQQICTEALNNRNIISATELAHRFHLSIRTLERLFSKYVGVNPKWGIKIFRFHEVVERIADNQEMNWAQLATDLGYFDQAHFIKDFRAMIGKTPQEYAGNLH